MSVIFQEDLKYSFEVYPASILKMDFTDATSLGVVSESIARKFVNTRELHVNVYPYLPAGSPNDPTAYGWLGVRLSTGVETFIGVAWIKPDTITSSDWNTIIATVLTNKPNAVNLIRAALASNDFDQVTIEVGKK